MCLRKIRTAIHENLCPILELEDYYALQFLKYRVPLESHELACSIPNHIDRVFLDPTVNNHENPVFIEVMAAEYLRPGKIPYKIRRSVMRSLRH